jgi:PAS domain S-box-containing protein
MKEARPRSPAPPPPDPTGDAASRLAAFVDSSADAIVTETLDGIITSWNPAAEALFGWPAAAAVGRHVRLIIPPERHAEEADVLARVRRGEVVDHFETVRLTKNGRLVDVFLTVSPVKDSSGRIVGASKIARDITERRRFDETRARLAAIVESSEDVIVSKDLDGIITSWNPAAERMFGWTAAEAIGRPITLIIPEERRAEEDEVIAKIRRGERVEHFDTVRISRDRRLIDVSLTLSPVRDSTGRVVGASKIARDITERRRLEEERRQLLANERAAREDAERANRAKDEFLAVVSHELRTPLNGVFGWARMLQSADMDEPTRQRALAAIVRGAAAQVRLIEDLIDVSRMVAGSMRLELGLVDLRHVIEAALETVRPAAVAKHIEIEADFDGTEATVLGAADRLQQVLWNLLMNAVKFTPRGGRARVRLHRRETAAEITVTDSGEGIGPDALPYVFERFRQEDSSSTRAHAGLGLGLALVQHMVELHGGSVTAASPGKGHGATFTVRLPLAPPAPGDGP